uniref:Uncharacterized protein n=1 Tax=Salix viminalis TaxID=40686 RepID=A0A6N2LU47_SALVM
MLVVEAQPNGRFIGANQDCREDLIMHPLLRTSMPRDPPNPVWGPRDPPDASPTNPSSTSFGFGWINNSQPKSNPPPSLSWRNQTRGEGKVSSEPI